MKKQGLYITVKIIPNSKKNEIIDYKNDTIKIRIKKPPEKNKANKELIYFLAQELGISYKDISIVSGKTAKIKKLFIKNISDKQLDILKKSQ